jgi:hypothetical protein
MEERIQMRQGKIGYTVKWVAKCLAAFYPLLVVTVVVIASTTGVMLNMKRRGSCEAPSFLLRYQRPL